MATLNKIASELMVELGAHACTDVTGFGLMGHLAAMARASEVDVEVVWDDVPLFTGVIDCVARGIVPGAVERNKESVGDRVVLGDGVQPAMLDVCCDAQTSGGLLIAIAEAGAQKLLARLHEAGVAEAAAIGKVLAEGAGRVFLQTRGARPIPEYNDKDDAKRAPAASARPAIEQAESEERCCPEHEDTEMACCEDGDGAAPAAATGQQGVAEIQQRFQDFMKLAGAPGALDVATKQAIAIALSTLAKCEPCLKTHIKKARSMGFTQEEIDEAAWIAISFGGSPTMMFYNALRRTSDGS